MDFIYLLVNDGCEWEDIVVYLSKDVAIEKSKRHPSVRVEIFSRNNNNEYIPTYNYYKNGEYIQSQ